MIINNFFFYFSSIFFSLLFKGLLDSGFNNTDFFGQQPFEQDFDGFLINPSHQHYRHNHHNQQQQQQQQQQQHSTQPQHRQQSEGIEIPIIYKGSSKHNSPRNSPVRETITTTNTSSDLPFGAYSNNSPSQRSNFQSTRPDTCN